MIVYRKIKTNLSERMGLAARLAAWPLAVRHLLQCSHCRSACGPAAAGLLRLLPASRAGPLGPSAASSD
jgi:hypothetical protein